MNYRQTSNISRTLVDNKIVDHSDVVGASPVGSAPTTSSFSIFTPGFNGLGKDNCKTRRVTFKFWGFGAPILEIWRHSLWPKGIGNNWHRLNRCLIPFIISLGQGRFKKVYELVNLRVPKFSTLNKNRLFQCMGEIFYVEFQSFLLKFHTKYLTHTLKDVYYINVWKFVRSYIYEHVFFKRPHV